MKKLFSISVMLLLMLGMAACSSTEQEVPGVDSNGSLKLHLKGLGNAPVVTYVAPETGEGLSGAPVIDLYRFATNATGDGLFQEKTTVTLQQSGTDWIADVPGLTGTGEYTYYIVANGGSEASLAGLIPNNSDESDIKGALSDILADQATISTPLLITCKANNTTIGGVGTISGTLRRPVARFDVVHNNTTDIDVLEIIVKDGRNQGLIFPAAATAMPVIGTYKLALDATTFVYTDDGAGEFIQKSAFYLHPTELDNPTAIGIKVKRKIVGAIEEILYVDPSSLADKNIKANHRYKLIVDYGATDNLVLKLEVVDWNEGEDYTVDHKTSVGFASDIVASGSTTVDNINRIIYIDNDYTASTITFDLQASSPRGFSLSYDHTLSDNEVITVKPINTNAIATYVAAYYSSAVSIDISPYYGYKGFERMITFTDNASPDAIATVRIISKGGYPETGGLAAYTINGVRWAPVDVGSIDTKVFGSYFQWGRNMPLNIDTYTIHNTSKLSYEDAHSPLYANKTITIGVGFEWCTEPAASFWGAGKEQGPCPRGWKIPTDAQALTILDRYRLNGEVDATDNLITMLSDEGKEIMIPNNMKAIDYRTGGVLGWTYPVYWTRTLSTQANASQFWAIREVAGGVGQNAPAAWTYGFRIRCVWAE